MIHQPITAPSPARIEAERLIAESNRYPVNSSDWVWRRRAAATLDLWSTDAAPRDYAALLAAREAQGPLYTRAELEAQHAR